MNPHLEMDPNGNQVFAHVMDVLLIQPPATKPAEPPLGVATLLGHLRSEGFAADAVDANLEAYRFLLDPQRLERAIGEGSPTSLKRALRHVPDSLALLRSPEGTRSFARYSTAVRYLSEALSVYTGAGGDERVTLGDYVHEGLSEYAPADLGRLARGEAATLFREYFTEELVPRVVALRPRLLALSINYRNQVLPALELAGLLRRALPGVRIVAGGGMISSWAATLRRLGTRLEGFDHLVFGPGEAALAALARNDEDGDDAGSPRTATYLVEDASVISFIPDYGFARVGEYLSPHPVLPVSATRGCYWRGCLFCPEAAAPTHPYRCNAPARVTDYLEHVVKSSPVRHFHLTDNAVPVNVLRELAAGAPALADIEWHGFVRFERALLDADLVDGLARGGCTLLQLGLESGSQRVLDRLGKGTRVEEASAILRNLARAGIETYVYVMLGTPGETEQDAELTLRFLEEHADAIGFLNIAIMNLPRDAALLEEPERHGIRSATVRGASAVLGGGDDANDATSAGDEGEPLALYQSFEAANGWDRAAARRFLNRRMLGSPAVRAIVNRTPPYFTSNHAFFFRR